MEAALLGQKRRKRKRRKRRKREIQMNAQFVIGLIAFVVAYVELDALTVVRKLAAALIVAVFADLLVHEKLIED